MTTMEVYWKESYNIILIMGRWALAAMRKQKGEFERAQCTHKRAKRDAAWFVFRSTGKMDYTARPVWAAQGYARQAERLGGGSRRKNRRKKRKAHIYCGRLR